MCTTSVFFSIGGREPHTEEPRTGEPHAEDPQKPDYVQLFLAREPRRETMSSVCLRLVLKTWELVAPLLLSSAPLVLSLSLSLAL